MNFLVCDEHMKHYTYGAQDAFQGLGCVSLSRKVECFPTMWLTPNNGRNVQELLAARYHSMAQPFIRCCDPCPRLVI